MEWTELLSYIIGIIGIIFGSVFVVKWRQAMILLKELGEAFAKTSEALEDKKVTKEEAINLLKEWHDVVGAFTDLLPVKK